MTWRFWHRLNNTLDLGAAFVMSQSLRLNLRLKDRPSLERQIQMRLSSLVKWVYQKSPFYRELYKNAGVDVEFPRLEDIPPVTKEMLMSNYDRALTIPDLTLHDIDEFCRNHENSTNSIPYFQGRYFVIRSSGTSGLKGLFLYDRKYFREMLAAVTAYRPFDLIRDKKTHVTITGLFSPDNYHLGYTTFLRLKAPGIRATAVPASSSLEDIVNALNNIKPDILAGYPSVLNELISAVNSHSLNISPRQICCGGESLSPRTQDTLRDVFQCPVFNFYGSAEANPIAIQCHTTKWLHIIEDFVILEPVDQDLYPVPPGTLSHSCLLTNLHSRTIPLIRYRLDDQIVMSKEPCSCGSIFHTIMEVRGRLPNMINMQHVKGHLAAIHPESLLTICERENGLAAFQVTQLSMNRLLINVILREKANPEDIKARLLKKVHDLLIGYGVSIDQEKVSLDIVDRLQPDPRSGKVCAFISNLSIE